MDNIKHSKQALLLLCFLFLLSCDLSCAANAPNGTTIGSHNTNMCIEHERQALLKFKQGIRVDRCGLLSSWEDHDDDRNCCQWHGVRCSNITGHVIMLSLRGAADTTDIELYLKGKVGSSLGDLKHLRYLDLSFNDFSDQAIPHSIGSLVNLKYLNLSNSGFQGEIPPQLGNLSNLVSLDLSNSYSLNVKSLLWLSHLTMLRSVILTGVDLSKATNWLQVVNNLYFLRVLELEFCFLPPPVSRPLLYQNSSTTLSVLNLAYNVFSNQSSIVFGWLFNLSGINSHLTHLDLRDNDLGGPLPSAFGNLQALSYLDLSFNEFQGSIPSSFGNMQSLSYLSLSNNQLKGQIPNTISNIKPLTHLDLSDNNFQSLPKTLGNLCSLQELNLGANNLTYELSNIIRLHHGCETQSLLYLTLSDNHIWGHIDLDFIGNFSSLRELSLVDNQLNGTIPHALGNMSTMVELDLSFNLLEGTLSDIHFSNLSNLKYLDLSYNSRLALDVSVDWVPPFQLETIRLRSCRLGPLFPKWLLSQTNYSYLDISNTGIFDSIPANYWSSLPSQLGHLNLSHNKIYGTVPDLSRIQLNGVIVDIIELDLSFNNLEGAIPLFPSNTDVLLLNNNKFTNPIPFMCPKSKIHLSILDLSNNLLSGELPDCWMNFPQLSFLHIENNNFLGFIPSSIGYLEQLQALHLRNNGISGGLPRSLLNLTSLILLDLGKNLLSGHIPPSIGNSLRNVSILSLQGNNFDGKLPLSLCQMSLLQVLDLSSNHFFGTIPKCIYNFTAMHDGTQFMPTLYYQVENVGGKFDLADFVDAVTLLWKRKEWSFKNSSRLVKSIDISNNELEGEIPTEFSFLKGLGSLNLSTNNLIGAIPPELGQLTALQILDLSRNQISGEVPTSFELDSLGILNLSYNHLVGKIPDVPHLQTFEASAFIGNPGLCGLPLPKCPQDQPHDNNSTTGGPANHQDEDDNDGIFTVGLYVSVILGFVIGFWGVCGTLVLKRSWRHAFFRFLEDMRDKFSFQFSLNIARLRRRH